MLPSAIMIANDEILKIEGKQGMVAIPKLDQEDQMDT